MKNKEVQEILKMYSDDFEIAIQESFGSITVTNNDFTFEEITYEDNSSPNPYYKLVLTPFKEDGKDSYQILKGGLL